MSINFYGPEFAAYMAHLNGGRSFFDPDYVEPTAEGFLAWQAAQTEPDELTAAIDALAEGLQRCTLLGAPSALDRARADGALQAFLRGLQ